MPYRLLIYIHVLSAIGSIGPFFILFPIVKKLPQATGEALIAYIHTFRSVVLFTKHSGHVLVGSGVLLVLLGPWNWNTSWILMTLVIMFLSIFFLARAFSPTLKRFEEAAVNKHDLAKKLNRTLWNYLILLLVMLWFMVVKPTLW
ncbi:hypothetical protein M3182_01465 [Mesobacillus maritimus]|uniref:hypothetical protein n=1 Tax=Mesobacillus maritimus TaxID=1643336 RepID=UPI002040C7FB|nr:hypothetical protein [Mesobacillus maritimus]MCM3584408.1 hypothetical protein [Mesobacillus maritimus]MCM3670859.1 hypothetical protein [Mesobacillus maritimus]